MAQRSRNVDNVSDANLHERHRSRSRSRYDHEPVEPYHHPHHIQHSDRSYNAHPQILPYQNSSFNLQNGASVNIQIPSNIHGRISDEAQRDTNTQRRLSVISNSPIRAPKYPPRLNKHQIPSNTIMFHLQNMSTKALKEFHKLIFTNSTKALTNYYKHSHQDIDIDGHDNVARNDLVKLLQQTGPNIHKYMLRIITDPNNLCNDEFVDGLNKALVMWRNNQMKERMKSIKIKENKRNNGNKYIIFDWDDTLYPTTFTHSDDDIVYLDSFLCNLFKRMDEDGWTLIIISDAYQRWLSQSVPQYQKCSHFLSAANIISTRDVFGPLHPYSSSLRKAAAFRVLFMAKNDDGALWVSVGDSLNEVYGAEMALESLDNKPLLHQIKVSATSTNSLKRNINRLSILLSPKYINHLSLLSGQKRLIFLDGFFEEIKQKSCFYGLRNDIESELVRDALISDDDLWKELPLKPMNKDSAFYPVYLLQIAPKSIVKVSGGNEAVYEVMEVKDQCVKLKDVTRDSNDNKETQINLRNRHKDIRILKSVHDDINALKAMVTQCKICLCNRMAPCYLNLHIKRNHKYLQPYLPKEVEVPLSANTNDVMDEFMGANDADNEDNTDTSNSSTSYDIQSVFDAYIQARAISCGIGSFIVEKDVESDVSELDIGVSDIGVFETTQRNIGIFSSITKWILIVLIIICIVWLGYLIDHNTVVVSSQQRLQDTSLQNKWKATKYHNGFNEWKEYGEKKEEKNILLQNNYGLIGSTKACSEFKSMIARVKCKGSLSELQLFLKISRDYHQNRAILYHLLSDANESRLYTHIGDLWKKVLFSSLSSLKSQIHYKSFDGRKYVHLFGSSATKLDEKGSDIDLYLTTPINISHSGQWQLFEELSKELNSNNGLKLNVTNIFHCTVPIIKIFDEINIISVDISFGKSKENEKIVELLNVLCDYNGDKRIRSLIIAIKYWAKRRNLIDAKKNKLSSFGFVLLVIRYLQSQNDYDNKRILPMLRKTKNVNHTMCNDVELVDDVNIKQNHNKNIKKMSLSHLLNGFFQFYSDFDYVHQSISLFKQKVIKNNRRYRDLNGYKMKRDKCCFVIEDPIQTNYNCSKNVRPFSANLMKIEFMRSKLLLRYCNVYFNDLCSSLI